MTGIDHAQTKPDGSVYPSLLLYSLLIATSFPVGALVANDIAPTMLTALRFLVASLIFLVILITTGQLKKPSLKLLALGAALGAVMAIFFSLMFEALKTASALNTGAIFTLSPLLAMVSGHFINKVTAAPRQIIFLLIAAAGAIWVVFKGDINAMLALDLGRGEFIFFLGTLAFSFYSPITKRFYDGSSILELTFWILVSAFLLTTAFSLSQATFVSPMDVPVRTWGAILYLAFFTTAVTFFITTRASTRISPFKVASFVYLVPAFVAFIQLVVFGQVPSLSVTAGILVTGMATFLLQFDTKARP